MHDKHYLLAITLTMLLACSTHMISIDYDTYMQNQASYKNEDIIITAEIGQVLDNYEVFEGKRIETHALISHFEERDSMVWHLILEKEGKKLRAYEDDFLGFVPPDAVYLARWAKNEGGSVTARGELRKGGMELNQLTYKSLIVNTSAIPT